MELKDTILQGTIQAFNKKGLKFTMDDIAAILGISKKTIYTVFRDKEELFLTMVDTIFDTIKESEQAIMDDEKLSTVEKIQKVLGVMPEGYQEIDFRQLYSLRDKYPKIYKQVEKRLETGWEPVLVLMEQGMKEGVIRQVRLPLVKLMMEAAVEQFFQRDILIRNQVTYTDALQEVVEILLQGIVENKAQREEIERKKFDLKEQPQAKDKKRKAASDKESKR